MILAHCHNGLAFKREDADWSGLRDLLHEAAFLLRRGLTGDMLTRNEAERADLLLALLPTRNEIMEVRKSEQA